MITTASFESRVQRTSKPLWTRSHGVLSELFGARSTTLSALTPWPRGGSAYPMGAISMASDERDRKGEVFDAQTRMAAHRTFLAYIRTGLGAMSLGFVIARFNVFLWKTQQGQGLPLSVPWLPLWLGLALTVFGVAINIAATVHHFRLMRRANLGEPYRPEAWSPDLVVGVGMVLFGLAIVVDLFKAR